MKGFCMPVEFTAVDYQSLASWKGMIWTGARQGMPENTLHKTEWTCKRGHKWEARYADVYMGRTCPICKNHKVKVEADYKELAKQLGIEFMGPTPENSRIMTLWRRSEDDIFLNSYRNLAVRQVTRPEEVKGLRVEKRNVEQLQRLIKAGLTQSHDIKKTKSLQAILKDDVFLFKKEGKVKVLRKEDQRFGPARPVGKPKKPKRPKLPPGRPKGSTGKKKVVVIPKRPVGRPKGGASKQNKPVLSMRSA